MQFLPPEMLGYIADFADTQTLQAMRLSNRNVREAVIFAFLRLFTAMHVRSDFDSMERTTLLLANTIEGGQGKKRIGEQVRHMTIELTTRCSPGEWAVMGGLAEFRTQIALAFQLAHKCESITICIARDVHPNWYGPAFTAWSHYLLLDARHLKLSNLDWILDRNPPSVSIQALTFQGFWQGGVPYSDDLHHMDFTSLATLKELKMGIKIHDETVDDSTKGLVNLLKATPLLEIFVLGVMPTDPEILDQVFETLNRKVSLKRLKWLTWCMKPGHTEEMTKFILNHADSLQLISLGYYDTQWAKEQAEKLPNTLNPLFASRNSLESALRSLVRCTLSYGDKKNKPMITTRWIYYGVPGQRGLGSCFDNFAAAFAPHETASQPKEVRSRSFCYTGGVPCWSGL